MPKDLSSLWSCGDLIVGNRRYLMMPNVFHASARQVRERRPPASKDFKGSDNIILTKGDRTHLKACEPLIALLDRYDREGEAIDAADATRRANAVTQAAWEKQNPAPPPSTTVKIWRSAVLETQVP